MNNITQYNNEFSAKNGLKLFHSNIRSISKNFNELLVLLKLFVHAFDIIILTETFHIQDLKPFEISGYSIVYSKGNFNKNDGVVVYIKDGIAYECEVISLGEISTLQIILSLQDHTICITALYRLHPTSPVDFNKHLRRYLNEMKLKVDYSIIVGDININILDQKDFTQEYLNIMTEQGYVSQVNKYTRVDGERKSCIDHIFTKTALNQNQNVFTPIILREQITDHYPLILHVNVRCEINKNKTQKVKYFINYNSLRQTLEGETWNEVYCSDNIDNTAKLFISKLQYLVANNTYSSKINKTNKPRKEWVTDSLVKSIQTKNELHRRSKQNPDNPEVSKVYRDYKSKLTKLIKIAKFQYYNKQIDKFANSTKGLYNIVQRLCGTKIQHDKTDNFNKIKLPNGSYSVDKREIAEHFSAHYATYGQKLASAIIKVPTSVHLCPKPQTMFMQPTDETEIEDIIGNLKSNTSPGFDNIRTETLKEIKSYIKKPIAYIVNKIIGEGKWPDSFKRGIIKPIYKNGDKYEVKNYRPITLISNISKIAEKVIGKRVTNYAEKYGLLSDSQYGFRQGRSASDALTCLVRYIYDSLDKKNHACVSL